MKDYKEVAESVQKRSREQIANKRKRRIAMVKTGSIAVCLCLVAGSVVSSVMFIKNKAKPTEQDILESNSSIYYSQLSLAEDQTDPEILEQFGRSQADIAGFDENMLSQDCCAILEGKIVDMYLRKNLPENNDESQDASYPFAYSLIYELKVEKVWYSRQAVADTVFIENPVDFIDTPCAMRSGRSYVVALHVASAVHHDFAESVSEEETVSFVYSIIYPFHPQIEVTEEGNYIVSNDWETLVAENAIPIIVDIKQVRGYDIFGYYSDKMSLVPAETFSKQLSTLMKAVIGE